MAFESWDDAMFWYGSLIGYAAGVKSTCKDEDKSSLLLKMADIQARLEFIESENVKLHNEVDNLLDFEHLTSVAVAYAGCDECGEYKQTMLRLFAENKKLRELASLAAEYISYDRCEGCVTKTACSNHELDECWMVTKLHNQLRELRIEVDDGREA